MGHRLAKQFQAWQAEDLLHSLTCWTDSRHGSLTLLRVETGAIVVHCAQCGQQLRIASTDPLGRQLLAFAGMDDAASAFRSTE